MAENIEVHPSTSEKCSPTTYHDSVTDTKGLDIDAELGEQVNLKQGLKQRHIQMIALAGTIGTGLFLGSGRALATGGPAGVFLGYLLISCAVCPVVLAIGEMGTLVPLSGGIVRYTEYFADPALSFAIGWNIVYTQLVNIPAEIVAAAVLIDFWVSINNAVWITIFSLVTLAVSFSLVRIYGEVEFFFSMIKILLIVGINLMAIVITCGGGPDHKSIGFHYWRDPGAFTQYKGIQGATGRFLGFWTVANNAVYAFSGIDHITIPAAETKNPRQAIPQATKRIFWRVSIFYVVTIFMMTLVVPSNDKELLHRTGTAAESPFVIAATKAGIKVVPSIINAAVMTSAFSSANAAMIAGTRSLFGLAKHGHAPKIFTRLNRFSVPWVSIVFIGLFLPLGYMTLSNSAAVVFTWLQDLVSVATLVSWIITLITYLRFYYGCKAQGIHRKTELPWAAPLQPWSSWMALGLFSLILITGGWSVFLKGRWDTETFVSSYLNIPLTLALYFGCRFVRKTRWAGLGELPLREMVEHAKAHPEPPQPKKKGWQKVNILS